MWPPGRLQGHQSDAVLDKNPLKNQFLRFALVGSAATLTTYVVLIVGVEGFQVNAVIASVVGYALGIAVNYVLNYRYTFGSDQHHHIVLPRFLLVMFLGMFLNAAIMYSGTKWLGVHYMIAQLCAVAIVFMLSFSANRLWAFAD
jgi:putative flippase GtrA